MVARELVLQISSHWAIWILSRGLGKSSFGEQEHEKSNIKFSGIQYLHSRFFYHWLLQSSPNHLPNLPPSRKALYPGHDFRMLLALDLRRQYLCETSKSKEIHILQCWKVLSVFAPCLLCVVVWVLLYRCSAVEETVMYDNEKLQRRHMAGREIRVGFCNSYFS